MLEDRHRDLQIELRDMLDSNDIGLKKSSLPKTEERSVNNPAVRRKRILFAVSLGSVREREYERLLITIDYDNKKENPRYNKYKCARATEEKAENLRLR
jgi:hypothetical protein